MNLPKRVVIREVGPRDGLQNEAKFVSTEEKVNLIERLVKAGIKDFEVTSFVHPKAVPQHRDAEELLALLPSFPDVSYSALIANARGVERAVSTGIKNLILTVSASETHNKNNINKTIQESISEMKDLVPLAKANGISVRGTLSTVFGCPWEGKKSLEQVSRIVEGMSESGIQEIALADTAGLGNPYQIYSMSLELKKRFPGIVWGLHLHDTRGLGLANILAALQAGIGIIETSIGGLGGCPFVPGATGNVVTEDVVYMLGEMGLETGIDLDEMIAASQYLSSILGHPLPSKQLSLCKY